MIDIDSRTLNRFWSRVNKTKGCWLWVGSTATNGYGGFMVGGKNFRVHRLSYELIKGEIPDGLQIDHLCRVRNCVNPDHLEAVTQRENIFRGVAITVQNARKTHCKYGHAFTPENTGRNGKGRRCKVCVYISGVNRRKSSEYKSWRKTYMKNYYQSNKEKFA